MSGEEQNMALLSKCRTYFTTFLFTNEWRDTKKRVPRDINFFFYFKIFSQQDETQRSPEGPKPIEPSRTEAPLIIAMSLCCRTRCSGEREKERKKGKGEETKSSTETHKHIHSSIHIQKELCETQWWWLKSKIFKKLQMFSMVTVELVSCGSATKLLICSP